MCLLFLLMILSLLSVTPNVFIYFCQLSLNVNTTVCQGVCPLIDYNIDIDSWYCWDCDLSIIGTVRPVDASFRGEVEGVGGGGGGGGGGGYPPPPLPILHIRKHSPYVVVGGVIVGEKFDEHYRHLHL